MRIGIKLTRLIDQHYKSCFKVYNVYIFEALPQYFVIRCLMKFGYDSLRNFDKRVTSLFT